MVADTRHPRRGEGTRGTLTSFFVRSVSRSGTHTRLTVSVLAALSFKAFEIFDIFDLFCNQI